MKNITIPLDTQKIINELYSDIIKQKDQIILYALHELVDPEDINFSLISVKCYFDRVVYYYNKREFLVFYEPEVVTENKNLYLKQEYVLSNTLDI